MREREREKEKAVEAKTHVQSLSLSSTCLLFCLNIPCHHTAPRCACQGYADQTGGPEAANTKLNIPLPPHSAYQPEYHAAVSKAILAAQAFQAQALVVSMGLDTYANDPVAAPGAGFRVEIGDYERIGRVLGQHPGGCEQSSLYVYFYFIIIVVRVF